MTRDYQEIDDWKMVYNSVLIYTRNSAGMISVKQLSNRIVKVDLR